MNIYKFKKEEIRYSRNICHKCGQKPCNCRLPKRVRKNIPEVLASRLRIVRRKDMKSQMEPWEFRLLTLRVSEEWYKELSKDKKYEEVLAALDRGAA